MKPSHPTPEEVALAYAQSAGWGATIEGFAKTAGADTVGHVFPWRGVMWEVMAHFSTPCCGSTVVLVRRMLGTLRRWQGIECPRGCSHQSWTVECDPEG